MTDRKDAAATGDDQPRLTRSQQAEHDNLTKKLSVELDRTLRRQMRSLEGRVDALSTTPSIGRSDQCLVTFADLEKRLADADTLIAELEMLDPNAAGGISAKIYHLQEYLDDIRRMHDDARTACDAPVAATAAPAQGGAAPAASGPKPPVAALKPDLLQPEIPYDEFDAWKQQVQDYFLVSELDKLDRANQRVHLRSCMSAAVTETVKHYLQIPDTHTVDQVLTALTEYWQRINSVVQRRNKWYELKQ